MKRIYEAVVKQHFEENDQMLFLAGPRQVGKTTIAQSINSNPNSVTYLNFDIEKDRLLLLTGEVAVLEKMDYFSIVDEIPLLILDEFHKYKHWKQFLKGFYDQYKTKIHILVTGSAKLNIYKKGGDSLMGRYFLYRVHPLSVGELLHHSISENLINPPKKLTREKLQQLVTFGGYPEPFIKENNRFSLQWRKLRRQQLFREDIQSLKQVQDIPHIEMLAQLLREQACQLVNYANLASALKVSSDSVIRWINILEEFYYCFRLKPWYKNVKRSLVKEPKVYLWDWAEIENPGSRIENMVASHLLKAVNFWNDYGLGNFGLYFLRDKEKREIDFIVTREEKPWFLVEVKNSENHSINKNLYYFKQQLDVPHAFQLAFDKPFVDKDCFSYTEPVIAPLVTFLSQLI